MNSTYYGKTGDLIITDIQYTDALDDVPSGTITCTFPGTIAEAIAAAPEPGTSTELLPESSYDSLGTTIRVRLVLTNRTFSGGKDGSVTVTLKYGFREEDANSTDAQPTSYKVSSTTTQSPILLHPRYADVPEREKLLASALVDGTKPYETVYLSKNELVIKTKIDTKEKENYIMTTLEDAIKKVVTSERGKELIKKINAGIKFYKTFGSEFTETSYSTAMNTTVKNLGKISTPPNVAPSKGSWLLSGVEASKERGERRWKIEKKWISSDDGAEWDKELYGD